MASASIPAPGTEYGPCASLCGHIDCAESRALAESACRFCGNPIGYGTDYYRDEDGVGYVHALCLEQQAERDEKERRHDAMIADTARTVAEQADR